MQALLLLALLMPLAEPTTIRPRAAVDAPTVKGRITSAADTESGKGKIAVGEMVKLYAAFATIQGGNTSIVDQPTTPTAYEWELANAPAGYKLSDWIEDDGRYVVFATGVPGDYHFTVGISQWLGGPKPLLKLAKYTLSVSGPPTTPNVPTTPKPVPPTTPPTNPPEAPPTDDEIQGLFGLAPKVRDRIVLLPKVTAMEIAGLALNYREVAEYLTKPEATVREAQRKLVALNAAVLKTPEQREAWSAFWPWINGEMNKLDAAGKLADPVKVCAAFAEIYLGFTLAGELRK